MSSGWAGKYFSKRASPASPWPSMASTQKARVATRPSLSLVAYVIRWYVTILINLPAQRPPV